MKNIFNIEKEHLKGKSRIKLSRPYTQKKISINILLSIQKSQMSINIA